MEAKSTKKIAVILFSNGLEYDDRIRKEIDTIRSLHKTEIEIFTITDDNRSEKGITSYGISYEMFKLKARSNKYLKHFLFIKGLEFFFRVRKRIKKHEILWIVDIQPVIFALLSSKRIIWDLHEVPEFFLGSPLKKIIFQIAEYKCFKLIHANKERLSYLFENGLVNNLSKNTYIRNFPDKFWLNNPIIVYNKELDIWLGQDDYVYIQGIQSYLRYPLETLSAIIESNTIKAVVVGKIPNDLYEKLYFKYGNLLLKTIFFVGQINQEYTKYYIERCKFTMVFYSTDTTNNSLCEPNRLFQALAMGKPAIVGNNITMKPIIDKYKVGIALDSDGRDTNQVIDAIFNIIQNYNNFQSNLSNLKNLFLWEQQISTFKHLI